MTKDHSRTVTFQKFTALDGIYGCSICEYCTQRIPPFAALRAGGDPCVSAGLLQHENLLRRPREGAQEAAHRRQRSILGRYGPDAGCGGPTLRDERFSGGWFDFATLGLSYSLTLLSDLPWSIHVRRPRIFGFFDPHFTQLSRLLVPKIRQFWIPSVRTSYSSCSACSREATPKLQSL